ncbi:uncharacterized protein METZ01_LOCUS470170, partial [marine metagenome]
MANKDRRTIPHSGFIAVDDLGLGHRIKRRGSLVKYQYCRVSQKCARDCDPLSFSCRDGKPTLTYRGLQSLW